MKNLKYFVLLLLTMVAVHARAYDFEADGIYYRITSKTAYTCAVTYKDGFNSYSGEVVVPASVTYNNQVYSVTSVYYNAFRSSALLKSVSLPEGVTEVQNGAFQDCVSLKSIVLPSTVTEVGGYCFSGCVTLESVDLGNCQEINAQTFYGCVSLPKISIPASVTEIENSAFENCTNLSVLAFEDGETELGISSGDFQLSSCPIDSIYLGRNLQQTTRTYFKNLLIRSVYISDAVTELKSTGIFAHCEKLQNVYGMNNVKTIGKETFTHCTSLKNFVIKDVVTSLGDCAFSGCSSLETVVIGNGIIGLGGDYCTNILSGCTNLKAIYLGTGVKEISRNGLPLDISPNIYLFSDVLSVYKYTYSSGTVVYGLPTSATVYVANPERYETLLGGTYNLKPLLTFNETSVEYTGRTPELTYKNNVEGMDVSFDSSTTPKDAGSYNTELDVTFSMPDWQTTVQIPCAYTVTKAPLSIMTNNAQRYYGEDNPKLTCEYVGFKNGETAEVLTAQPTVYTTATKDSYVGTYPIYCTGAEAKNYTITTQNGTRTIIKAPQTITWNQNFTGVHVGDQIELTATASSGLNVKYRSSDQTAVLITTQNGKQYAYILKEGIAAITAYQSGDTNHEEADEVTLLVNATTGINGIQADEEQDATYYNTSGQRVSQPSGLTIVRQSNGTTRKMIVK